jgi:hypothetical protein
VVADVVAGVLVAGNVVGGCVDATVVVVVLPVSGVSVRLAALLPQAARARANSTGVVVRTTRIWSTIVNE